jgi:hypothetical protein
MSDTPRTDVHVSFNNPIHYATAEFARQLERELAEAREHLEQLRFLAVSGAQESIKLREDRDKLAEALREIRGACMDKTIETNPDDDAKGNLDECIELAERVLAAVK